MIVVTASNSLDPTRCREGSLSEGEFILVPYNDGGVISCSTMDLPFQSEQYARRADWWKLPARFKHFWRALTDGERGVLDRLLSRDFPGRDELAVQAQNAAVTSIDREGSLRFCVTGPAANIAE
ncbi:MAG TPA: hypothetical protein VH743_00490, partial [Beijerinckiaceae bacterium]